MLDLGGPERAPCIDVHRIASAHLARVRSKLAELTALEATLAETVARCLDAAATACPVLDLLDSSELTD